MKKLFTFLTLLVVAAVSAFADTYTADLTGIVTQYGYRDKEASNVEAEVTSTGDNQYTIVLKQAKVAGELLGDLTFEGVTGKTYSDGTVSYSFDGDLSVSNAYGYDGYSDGSTHAATLTGASKDGQLYLDINSSIAFGMGSVSYELIYGTEITVPGDSDDPDDPGSAQTTTTYTDDLKSVIPSYDVNQLEVQNEEADVTSTGDNQYTIVLKKASIVGMLLGDLTFEGVTGKTYSDGTISYSFDGDLSVSNAEGNNGYTNGSTHAATLTGASKDGKLYLDIKTSMAWGYSTLDFELVYGTEITAPDEPDQPDQPDPGTTAQTTSYTNKATVTYNDVPSVVDDAKIDITTEADGSTTLLFHELTVDGTVIGDFTAKNVTVDTLAEDSVKYTFDGTAAITNVGPYAFIYGVGDSAPFSFTAVAAKGVLNGKFDTTLDAPVSIVYGTDPTLQPEEPGQDIKTVSYTDKATSSYDGTGNTQQDIPVDVTDFGNGKYTITYKNLYFGEFDLGTLTLENVDGTVAEDSTVNYTFDGEGTLTNLTDVAKEDFFLTEGATATVSSLTGESKDGKLHLKFTITVNLTIPGYGSFPQTATVEYGGNDDEPDQPDQPANPAVTYTDEAYSAVEGEDAPYDEGQATVDVTDNGDGTSTIVWHQVKVTNMALADVTISDVQTTANGDGTTTYAFAGKADLSNVTAYGQYFDLADGGTLSLSLEGTLKDGKLELTLKFYAHMFDDYKAVTAAFGHEIETVPTDPDDPSTGINSINADINAGTAEIYTLGGARVKSLQRGVNIVRTADGKTVKIIKK